MSSSPDPIGRSAARNRMAVRSTVLGTGAEPGPIGYAAEPSRSPILPPFQAPPPAVRVRRLQSRLLRGNVRLEDCLVEDRAAVREGDVGVYVEKLQIALFVLDQSPIDRLEVLGQRYGASTARAVLFYKQKRKISDRPAADNSVGKRTIDRLDREIADYESAMVRSELLGDPAGRI
jgi:hypothetical protein